MRPPAFLLTLALLLTVSIAHAEVIELEGKVKSIDKDARTISVVHKTAKGEKVLDLEVAKKAGDLSEVEEGDSVAFSYDPDLELITKIAEQGQQAEKVASIKESTGCRLRVHISDTGDITVGVGRGGKEGPRGNSKAVTRTEQEDGSWNLLYGFGATEFIDAYGWKNNVSIDAAKNTLVMRPGPSDKGNYLSAGIAPKGRFRVPIAVEIDVAELKEDAMLRLELKGGSVASYGQHLFFLRSTDGLRTSVTVEAATGQGKDATKHFEETVSLDKPFTKSFRLPIPNAKNNDVYTVMLGAFYKGSVGIQRLSIQGSVVPTFGIGLDQQANAIFVKQMLPDGLAKQAGMKEGDVVLTLNGDHPSSVADAMEKMMAVGFGKELKVVVKRGTQEKSFNLKAEWDE